MSMAARMGEEVDYLRQEVTRLSKLVAGQSAVIKEIAAERRRQVQAEGYNSAHDDGHPGQMALAAAAYAGHAGELIDQCLPTYYQASGSKLTKARWPWGRKAWKPKDPRRDLVRAAALIVAEIERMDRAAQPSGFQQPTKGE